MTLNQLRYKIHECKKTEDYIALIKFLWKRNVTLDADRVKIISELTTENYRLKKLIKEENLNDSN